MGLEPKVKVFVLVLENRFDFVDFFKNTLKPSLDVPPVKKIALKNAKRPVEF